uniref:E3 SUMO-protein ligase NSE2 n=1 Tax=Clastoptera arizonana TaxID=38151 RepID=A0A1B6CXK9_9HEMI
MASRFERDLLEAREIILENLDSYNEIIDTYTPAEKKKCQDIAEETFLNVHKSHKEFELYKAKVREIEEMIDKYDKEGEDEDELIHLTSDSEDEDGAASPMTKVNQKHGGCSRKKKFESIWDSIMNMRSECVIEDSECKNDPEYKEFMAKLHKTSDEIPETSQNAEHCITQVKMSYIDVLTQKTMVKPMKNIICGHHYERDHIFEWLKSKENVRCPYVGCSQQIFKNNLVLDKELMTEIENSKKPK